MRYSQIMEIKRNSNFELLRIITMLCVVATHTCAFTFETPGFLGKFYTYYYTFGLAGLNSFFMMSGYFMGNRPAVSKKKIISMFVQIIYCQIISLIVYVLFKISGLYSSQGITTMQIFGIVVRFYIVPITSVVYWYITVYMLLLALIPVINPFLQKLNVKGFIILLLIEGLIWYGFSFVFHYRYTHLQRAVFFYTLGVFFKFYANEKSLKRLLCSIGLFAVCYAISVTLFYLFHNEQARSEFFIKYLHKDIGGSQYVDMMLHYAAYIIFSPICSILLFEIFKNITFSCNIINVISATTFSVYLLHCQPLFNSSIRSIKLPSAPLSEPGKHLAFEILWWVLMFAICSAVDLIRITLLKNKIDSLTNKGIAIIKEKFYRTTEIQ